MITGYGKHEQTCGISYEGYYKNGNRHGKGKLTYPKPPGTVDQVYYDGDWNEDMQEGQGKYQYHNGDFYEGKFS